MLDDIVISVENLSKRYLVGHQGAQENYQSFRDTLVRHGKNLARKSFDMVRGRQIVQGDNIEEFWALSGVSFDIRSGEVLGIIGRNGAGKSTLLKVLSRITEPTIGRVTMRGRVASLLEVGTGFHPELTGRENIFLNGAILGMSSKEIRARFDEIVDFAGVEQFLDTPVKRYSSGMYVRLAFAVAAHLEPEILIVDEVLAVGDAEFQKKCLGKMQDVAKGGRTVLFVSHNLGSVSSMCTSCIMLKSGRLAMRGAPDEVISSYLEKKGHTKTLYQVSERFDQPYFEAIEILGGDGGNFSLDDKICFQAKIVGHGKYENLVVGFHVKNADDVEVIHSSSEFSNDRASSGVASDSCEWTIPARTLNVGHYTCLIRLAERNRAIYHEIDSELGFEIVSGDFDVANSSPTDWKGVIAPQAIVWERS